MRKQGAVVVAAVVAATAAATVVLPTLDDHDKPVEVPALSDEVVEIHPNELDRGSDTALDSGQPLACMFRLDCVMEVVERATGIPVTATPPASPPEPVPPELLPATG